ncbi:MAG: alpha/beta hydrolase [Planctomycetota bacterium]
MLTVGIHGRALAFESASFDSAGTKIHYTVEGTGEPVLLIHGYHANGNLNWRVPGVNRLLSPDYQVIAMDARGHGSSDKPTTVEAYGDNMVEDAVRLLDHLKIDRAHVVGYSMGGMITMKLTALHPERVKSAVIGGMGWFQGNVGGESGSKDSLDPLTACRMGFAGLGITKEQLEKIKTPMVVIIGTDDRLKNRVDVLEKIRPDVPVVTIEGANHLNCIFRPEFREGIKKYLDQQTKK